MYYMNMYFNTFLQNIWLIDVSDIYHIAPRLKRIVALFKHHSNFEPDLESVTLAFLSSQ